MNAISKTTDADHMGGFLSAQLRDEALSHAKGIYEQVRWNTIKLLHAPSGRPVEISLNMMLR
ncbi:MAG: hypothetical protein E5Y30_04460 [Mesorhizobium sp.]|nr:MAG: hypothetical protein E5Y30_04460 [Mesorhizobium sp.]